MPSAVRYKNWKIYYAMAGADATGGLLGPQTFQWTQITNIKRDPFEIAVVDNKSPWRWAARSRLPAPPTSMTGTSCPSAKRLWLKELKSYKQVSRRCRIRRATTSNRCCSR